MTAAVLTNLTTIITNSINATITVNFAIRNCRFYVLIKPLTLSLTVSNKLSYKYIN